MNIVSTLAATTTVGAAAVGYTFGIPQTSVTSDSYNVPVQASATRVDSRKAHRLSWNRFRPMSEVITSRHSSPAYSSEPLEEEQGSPRQIPDQNATEQLDCIGASIRHGPIRRDREYRPSLSPSLGDDSAQLDRRRSRPASWALSQTSSPQSSLHPSSLTPFIPQQPPIPPPPPNKLVKRSASQHQRSLSGSLLASEQTVKRPITSRQRSAMLASPIHPTHESIPDSPGPVFASSPDPNKKPYRHYFQVTVPNDVVNAPHASKTRGINFPGVRQVRPHESLQPVLLLGNSVEAPADVDHTAPETNKLVKTYGKPHGKPAVTAHNANNGLSPPASPARASRINTQVQSRRSFSIGDLLSFRTSPDELKAPRRKLQRPLSQRLTSAPALSNSYSPQSSDPSKPRSRNPQVMAAKSDQPFDASNSMNSSHTIKQFTEALSAERGTTADVEHSNPNASTLPKQAVINPSDSPSTFLSSSSFDPTRSTSQRSRYSATPSELASSNVESDVDGRMFSSGDEDDADMQSDTVYDSVRTGITRRSTTFPGSIFEKESAIESEHFESLAFQRHHQHSSPTSLGGRNDIITEEDETLSNPVQSRNEYDSLERRALRSTGTVPGNIDSLGEDSLRAHHDSSGWASDDERGGPSEDGESTSSNDSDTHSVLRRDFPVPPGRSQMVSNESALNDDEDQDSQTKGVESSTEAEIEPKTNVFDWSEQPRLDRVLSNGAPRLFNTVHGRQSREHRTSRSSGRRAPSGPHARSRSVPVLSDCGDGRANAAAKFGTWGVGSKGASEDWDDDFQFEDSKDTSGPNRVSEQAGQAVQQARIVIPQSIREQQTNVLANIGLLKEWGLLIEELKELRLRATTLGVNPMQHQSTFEEVDAMIDLADQEHEEELGPASRTRSSSPSKNSDLEGFDNFDADSGLAERPSEQFADTPTRPRKNSEAIALSVITAIQHRKAPLEGSPTKAQSVGTTAPAKLPFDKGTLKHILPHLQSLVKSLKDILRNVEGIEQRATEPALSRIFRPPRRSEHGVSGRTQSRAILGTEEETEEDWTID